MCPRQVDVGPNKPETFDWILSRTRDATKENAPREMIHFFNCLRDVQVRRFEIGEPEPDENQLFSRPSFKEALKEVSKVRLEQTLYAENPASKPAIEGLRNEKTSQTRDTLAKIWGIPVQEAESRANALSKIGFFELRGSRDNPEYWVPFLYRDLSRWYKAQLIRIVTQ